MNKEEYKQQVKRELKKHTRSGKVATVLMEKFYINMVKTLGYETEPKIIADGIFNLATAIALDGLEKQGWVVENVR